MGRRMTERLSVFALLSPSLLALTSTPAQAEMYVAGLVGDSIPYALSDVEGPGINTGLSSWICSSVTQRCMGSGSGTILTR